MNTFDVPCARPGCRETRGEHPRGGRCVRSACECEKYVAGAAAPVERTDSGEGDLVSVVVPKGFGVRFELYPLGPEVTIEEEKS
jgi:hypothetical protein